MFKEAKFGKLDFIGFTLKEKFMCELEEFLKQSMDGIFLVKRHPLDVILLIHCETKICPLGIYDNCIFYTPYYHTFIKATDKKLNEFFNDLDLCWII